MRGTLNIRLVLPSLLCVLMAGGAVAETRYATTFLAKPRGTDTILSKLFVTNTSAVDVVSIDAFFVEQATNGKTPSVVFTTQPLSPGEQATFTTPPGYQVGYFGIDSDNDVLLKAIVAVVPNPESSASTDIQEGLVIGVGDAFAAGSMAIIDAQWGITEIYVQDFSGSRTSCTADVFDDLGDLVAGGTGLALTVPALGMKRYKSVMTLIRTLQISVPRVDIVCNGAFFPQGYFWNKPHRDVSIISPEKEPDPPPPPAPPTVIYDNFSAFKPTKANPQKIINFKPPIGDYERFLVTWRITFQGWGPDGGSTDNFHGLLVLQWNNYKAGAMGSLTTRGPGRNFIRDVWGFGVPHSQKFRFDKGFNGFVVGDIYDLEYDFDLVKKLITIKIFDNGGNQIFILKSPSSKSPDLGGSIHRGPNDIFLIKLGDTGHEGNKSASIGWRYLIKKFELFPVASP